MSGIDRYTKLLLHCNGADASTTFIDSATGKAVTAVNQAQIDTAQFKFGGASALFDGALDYLSLDDSDDWDFGTGDFTLECWVRFNVIPTATTEYSTLIDNGRYDTGVLFRVNSKILTQVYIVNAVDDFATSELLVNTWYHFCLIRNGTNLKLFLNGVQQDTTRTNSKNITGLTAGVRVGSSIHTTADGVDGWIDEVRISKGIARWTANFTPPILAYSRPGGFFLFM